MSKWEHPSLTRKFKYRKTNIFVDISRNVMVFTGFLPSPFNVTFNFNMASSIFLFVSLILPCKHIRNMRTVFYVAQSGRYFRCNFLQFNVKTRGSLKNQLYKCQLTWNMNPPQRRTAKLDHIHCKFVPNTQHFDPISYQLILRWRFQLQMGFVESRIWGLG